jgi:hypothetical protein
MLQCLTLPTLETLEIASSEIIDYLLPLLERSEPPLHSLTLFTMRDDDLSVRPWPLATVQDCFRLTPTLTYLKLCGSNEDLAPFVAVLANATTSLPNLTSLAILLVLPPRPESAWYQQLVNAVSTRRTESSLQTFHLEWTAAGYPSHSQYDPNWEWEFRWKGDQDRLKSLASDGWKFISAILLFNTQRSRQTIHPSLREVFAECAYVNGALFRC